MVLQVLPDPRQVGHHRDSVALQMVGRPDAGQHQQLRRVDGAAGQDHLTAGHGGAEVASLAVLDAGGAAALEQHPRRHGAGLDRQIGPLHRRTQEGARRAPAHALMDGHVHPPEAFLLEAVHVLGGGIAGLDAGLDEGVEQRIVGLAGGDVQRPVAAAIFIRTLGPGLRLAKIGQYIGIGPMRQRRVLGPAVVVVGVAPDVDHGVQRRRAAQHPAARPVHGPAVHVLLRLCVVEPVVAVVGEVVGQRRRHMDLPGPVLRPRLQQQHPDIRVGRQPVGQHASGRAGTDNHVIEAPVGQPPLPIRHRAGSKRPGAR